ncbi:MAG: helix-turn-helix domain-containing protein [Clostridia bacterium]|nr:helix-turn-helix domain-containing protein [Clostridia bacterium]
MNNLGQLFRQIRRSKKWSVREAAKRLGISYSYLSILEKGTDPRTGRDSKPQPDTLRLISKVYDYPYEDLMKASGYLDDEFVPGRIFDLTVFISNLNLIMGEMGVEELSKDIYEKTGYTINPNQIRSYINGDIEPFPGTINILSKYARVTPDFWYMFNTKETLELERKKYQESIASYSTDQFNKDFLYFTSMSEDIKNWIVQEDSIPYIKLAMEAQHRKINPESLRLMIETFVSALKNG